MDLPPSGWYPDPYGTPALLRWWDGSAWTRHTQPDGAVVAGGDASAARAQATRVQPPAGALTRAEPLGAEDGSDGTKVLFFGSDTWQTPGGPARYGYGYQEARRRRRRIWLMGGLAAGTAAAVAVIAVVVVGLSPPAATTAADQTPVAPSSPAADAASPTPAPTPSASASTSTSPPAATLSDGQSGLSYTELTSPWQPTCPTDLNNGAFTWTSGESAIAGQVNGGQTAWYGEACSGPLPPQYGYTGVADLENTATSLANTFQGAYYSALDHTATTEVSQPVQVSGHAGWEVTYQVTYTNAVAQDVSWASEQAAVVVADAGTGNTPAVFFTSIPANLGGSTVASLVSSLRLSVVPQAGGSPNDDGSPAAGSNP